MKENDKREGLWIPISLIRNEELDWENKVLMAEIESLSKLKSGCIASNAYFGRLVGLSPGSVSKRITHLTRLGYIKTRNEYENHTCMGRVITLLNKVWEPVLTDSKSPDSVVLEQPGGTSPSTMGDISEQPWGSSQRTMEDSPERPGGSSQENTIITYINRDINTDNSSKTNSGLLEQGWGLDTGENRILLIPGTSLKIEDNPKWSIESELKYTMRRYLHWRTDIEELGLDLFIQEAKKFCRISPEDIEYIKGYQYYLSNPGPADSIE